jgi:hypothetical protein
MLKLLDEEFLDKNNTKNYINFLTKTREDYRLNPKWEHKLLWILSLKYLMLFHRVAMCM